MRHRKSGVKLNRTSSHRQAMFRNMVTSLFKHDRIKTTDAKAKELRRWADHIVTLAKRGDLHARRMAMSIVREKDVVHKLFEEASDRFGSINGGYTRIVKIGRRPGDAAAMTLVELVSSDSAAPVKKKTPAKAQAESVLPPETPGTAGSAPRKLEAKEEIQEAAPAEGATDAHVEAEASPSEEPAEGAASDADAEKKDTAADPDQTGK